MSGSASRASIYEKMIIRNDKKEANLVGKVASFNYFESVYSPEVTANLIFVDASGAIKADKAQDTQERLGSIKSSLPIIGDEDLEFTIKSKSGTLDFSKKPLRVNSAPVISEDSNRQSIFLSLVSNATIDNLEIKNPTITYKGRISNTVKKILRELKIRKFKIDKTRNSYDFISRSKGGLDLITDLCRRSIPTKGDPGYFFYETQDGHNFRAIDNLISKRPVETYTYTGGMLSNLDNDENDFRIVRPPRFIKDQNVKQRKKWMSSRNIFFNPSTLEVDEKFYTLKGAEGEIGTKVNKTLGKDIDYPNGSSSGYSKTNYITLDIGSLDYQNLTPNNDPREWQAKSPMRYNLLHSQMMEIQVPCNLELRAGDVIKVEIERQGDDKELGGLDEHTSGKYLIMHLCHHFDSKRSFTSMTLARDTYGLHVKDEENDNEEETD
tara:strand:- start:611 stop:1921 length:1311 start_codon:yes stop_codon:yes gene_type:complete